MEDHEMQIIEVDGVEVKPYTVDELSVSAAQRYSLLIEAKNETDKNYAFMVYQNTDMWANRLRLLFSFVLTLLCPGTTSSPMT
jgi:FtsP/CotA-like multicopper oxidase with cupredoxin domain